MQQLEHRVITRLGAGRECLVQTFAPEAGIFGKLCHAAGACDITHGGQKHRGVGVFKRGSNVFRDGVLVIEVISGVETGKFGQGSLLV